MNLTEAQKRAIRFRGRNLQLIACAGSGKTEVIARRVAHLLTMQGDARMEPRNIVAFTFTNKAAAELKERIVLRTTEQGGTGITGLAEMYVGTIHGFCQDLLQTEVPNYLKYEVLEPIRQNLYVNRNSQLTGLTASSKLNGTNLRRWVDTDRYIAALAIMREDEVDTAELEDCTVFQGLSRYRAQMTEDSYFDFSALLENAVEELATNDDLRGRIAERIKYVVVDEYQDVNPIQEQLVRLLHELGAGLCVVGDDDQTIYQWRGSSVANILNFKYNYPSVVQVRLEENFRSSEGVITTARGFVDKITPRLPKAMKFANAQKYENGDVVALTFESPQEEADYIVNAIKSLRGVAFQDGDSERGLSWSDMAVLLRSVKHNGTVISEALKDANIPFVVSGLANLFKTDEACAARDLFHFIADVHIKSHAIDLVPPTEAELILSWRSPNLGLSKPNLDIAMDYVKEVRRTLHSEEDGNPPTIQAVFLRFLELVDLREEKVPDVRGEVVLFNFGRFSQVIADWESIHFKSISIDFFQGFARFLYYQADNAYSEGAEDNDYMVPDAVQVMTVHEAKGREWPAVFLPALLRNRFPSTVRKSDVWQLIPEGVIENAGRYNGSIDDERRLFYVAMTRSKKFLHMTWAPIEGKGNRYIRKSAFWDDVLASKWVKRRQVGYEGRKRLRPEPRVSVANVEFSFSDLKYLFECGYQFKLRVLYGFNGPVVAPLGFGKSLHDALAEVHHRAMDGNPVSEGEVPELVTRHLRTPYATAELRARLETTATRNINNYINDNAGEFHHIEFSEKAIEINLGGGVSVSGRIDLVRRTDTNETTIVDLKSSERSQQEDVTELQLHTYALGYKQLTGRDADFVEIYELEERKKLPRPVDEDFIDDVRKETLMAASALREMRLEPSPSVSKCQQCDFSSICSAAMDSPIA